MILQLVNEASKLLLDGLKRETWIQMLCSCILFFKENSCKNISYINTF